MWTVDTTYFRYILTKLSCVFSLGYPVVHLLGLTACSL